MAMLPEDVEFLSEQLGKRFRMDVLMGQRSNANALNVMLKRLGLLAYHKDVTTAIRESQRHAMTVSLIKNGFEKEAIVECKDSDALFPFFYERSVVRNTIEDESEWKEAMDFSVKVFRSTIQNKLEDRFC